MCNIISLESVQKLFTSRLPGLQFISYGDRLRILKMHSLEMRRLRSDLILCYKILKGFVAGPPVNYGLTLCNRQSRGHNLKLAKEFAVAAARRSFFSNRIIDPWNALPKETVMLDSVLSFKRALTHCNFSDYLKQGFDVVG